ncbi:MAG: hypothetical protein ACLR8L_00045 [Oscillospiraceae bacterium]
MKTLKFTIRGQAYHAAGRERGGGRAVNHYELECRLTRTGRADENCCAGKRGREGGIAVHTGGLTLPWEVCKEGGLLLSVRGTKTLGDGRTQVVRTARMAKADPGRAGRKRG